jgi:glycerol-3-phosphate acyltransferase PlsX
MKLAIDVMGFENEVVQAIEACKQFRKLHDDVEFVLVGKKEMIKPHIKNCDGLQVINAASVIKMDTDPLMALRMTDSSMYQAIDLVATNQADGVLSAGSTPCYVAMVFYLLRKMDGINKIGFMPFLPTVIGDGFNLLDVGANKEADGSDIAKFAIMASIYCKAVRNVILPRVGIVNIGTEDNKGFAYHKEAKNLLAENKSINFVGYVEPRELLNGIVDIAVCDGYTGNLVLKAMEGGLKTIKNALKTEYKKP